MQSELFSDTKQSRDKPMILSLGAFFLSGFAEPYLDALIPDLYAVLQHAPLQQYVTRGGGKMSVHCSNCGDVGWVSDRKGYRYQPQILGVNQPWPAMPVSFLNLAKAAAAQGGYQDFEPDAALINRYQVGTKMGLHQDKDEKDFTQPIVSLSLGVTGVFLWGGKKRADKPDKYLMQHADMIVFGGDSRLNYHGILSIDKTPHPLFAHERINITWRKAN